MKEIRRLALWVPVLTLLCIATPSEVSASLVRQMSFEEVATQATVIVLGRVSEIPAMAVYDRATGDVYRRNRVQVQEYLKGSGPTPEIVVVTLGGEFVTDGLGLKGPRIQFVDYGGARQLPPVGCEVLLFLRPYAGGEAFIIYSVSHGVIRVQEGEKGQEHFVSLLFRDPDLVSPAAAARAREMHLDASGGPEPILISDRVALSDLKTTVERVLNRKRKPPAGGGLKAP